MYVRRLEQVGIDLVQVGDRAHYMSSNVFLVVEGLEAAEDAHIHVLADGENGGRGAGVNVQPDFDLDEARSVIESEGLVRGLCRDHAYLPDESYLSHFMAVYLEFCVWMGLLGVDYLFDRYGSECLFAVCLRAC